MKFSTQEEYGLRIILRIAYSDSANGLTIPEISTLEGFSQSNTAKILRLLRLGGFIESARGQSGGYKLARPSEQIVISDILEKLGGKLFEASFCLEHSGTDSICTNSINCSIRSLWHAVQRSVDSVTKNLTLKQLMNDENSVKVFVDNLSNSKQNIAP